MSKELREECIDIQVKLGVDDKQWEAKFGNKRGLYGFVEHYAEQREREVAKAYGGCTKCYGKGYATVNEYASGHATDGDIGGLEGRFKWKLDNIKPCSCDRGKQIEALQSKEEKNGK